VWGGESVLSRSAKTPGKTFVRPESDGQQRNMMNLVRKWRENEAAITKYVLVAYAFLMVLLIVYMKVISVPGTPLSFHPLNFWISLIVFFLLGIAGFIYPHFARITFSVFFLINAYFAGFFGRFWYFVIKEGIFSLGALKLLIMASVPTFLLLAYSIWFLIFWKGPKKRKKSASSLETSKSDQP